MTARACLFLSPTSVAGCALAAALAVAAPVARGADDVPAAAAGKTQDAEALFRAAKMLLGQRDYARACPLLSASVQIEAATGALLALAICHEGEGKLATAVREYQRAADRSNEDGRGDRAAVARERAAMLKPRLSTLTVAPPASGVGLPGFMVSCNGEAIRPAEWGAAVPRDGGEYLVDASAPGRKPWHGRVSLAASADHQVLAIPDLDPADTVVAAHGARPPVVAAADGGTVSRAPAAPAVSPGPALVVAGPAALPLAPGSQTLTLTETDQAAPASGTSALRLTGVALMGAGVAGLAVSAFYGARAMDRNTASRDNCNGDVCNSVGKSARLSALSSGKTATIAGIAGGAVLAAGIAAFVWGGDHGRGAGDGAREARVALAVEPGAARVLVKLSFSP